MKAPKNNRYLRCLLVAAASCSSLANAATPYPAPNTVMSYSDSIDAFNDVPVGGVPAEIESAITELETYKANEETNKITLDAALETAQDNLTDANNAFDLADTDLNDAIAAFDLANDAFTAADEALNTATSERDTASTDLTAAELAEDSAIADIAAIEADPTATDQQLLDAYAAGAAATQARIDAEGVYNEKEAAILPAETARNNAQTDLTAATTDKGTAQTTYDAAQADVGTKTAAVTTATNNVTTSSNKIAAYETAVTNITAAETAKADNPLAKAQAQYAAGGLDDTTGDTGLQSVIDELEDPTLPVGTFNPTAIDGAKTAFTGGTQEVADIEAYANSIVNEINSAPLISSADLDAAKNIVLNGAYERNAIDVNTTDIAALDEQINDAATGLDATKAIADEAKSTANATKAKVDDATTGLDATKAIADATKAKVDNATTGLDATKAIADATKAKVDNATTGLAATKTIADAANSTAATLTTNLATEKTERQAADANLDSRFTNYQTAQSQLIREENGQIHIGQNSLVTSEAGGFQELSAQDALGGSLDINVTNGSDLRIDGVSVATDDDISAIRSDYQAADRNLRNDIDTNTRGVAMVAAMTNTTIRDGMTQGVDFNISQFEGETGFAFGYAHKVNENVQIHGAAASTTDFEESVGRLGVSFQW
jgi:chromosome segregation ATPase